MAIEYTLYFDTETPVRRLYESACAGVGQVPDQTGTGSFAFAGGALQGVISIPNKVTKEIVAEEFSIDARVRVLFRLDKFALEEAQGSLVRCVSELMSANNHDATLLFNGELVVLRRVAGELVLRDDFGVWTPTRLSLLRVPYRVGAI